MPSEEELLPFGAPRNSIALATTIRGTVLLTSQRALRTRGLFDRYVKNLAPEHKDALLTMTAAAWVPMDVALAHYTACQELHLERDVILDIGGESGRFLNETVLSVVLRLSKEVGVTPWSALMHADRLRVRTWQGGKIALFKLGPKEARLEWVGIPVAGVPYYKIAFGGFIYGIITLLTSTAFVRELPRYCTATTLGYRCSWV